MFKRVPSARAKADKRYAADCSNVQPHYWQYSCCAFVAMHKSIFQLVLNYKLNSSYVFLLKILLILFKNPFLDVALLSSVKAFNFSTVSTLSQLEFNFSLTLFE